MNFKLIFQIGAPPKPGQAGQAGVKVPKNTISLFLRDPISGEQVKVTFTGCHVDTVAAAYVDAKNLLVNAKSAGLGYWKKDKN